MFREKLRDLLFGKKIVQTMKLVEYSVKGDGEMCQSLLSFQKQDEIDNHYVQWTQLILAHSYR